MSDQLDQKYLLYPSTADNTSTYTVTYNTVPNYTYYEVGEIQSNYAKNIEEAQTYIEAKLGKYNEYLKAKNTEITPKKEKSSKKKSKKPHDPCSRFRLLDFS